MASLPSRALTLVGLSFMIALTSACSGAASQAHSPGGGSAGPAEVGKLAPPLSIQSLNGKGSLSLSSLSGKVTVVDFWATWCQPCKKSFPKLEELAKQNPGKVEVVGISVDDTQDGVVDFAKAQGVTFPIGWDENHTLARKWSVEKMPTTYILDGTGTVRFVHEAYKDDGEAIGREVAQLTNEVGGSKAKAEVAPAPEAAPVTPVATAPAVVAAAPVAEEPAPEPAPEVAPPTKPKAKPAAKKPAAPKKKKITAPTGKTGA